MVVRARYSTDETQRSHQRQRRQRVATRRPASPEPARHEVIQAFGRAELREAVERRVDEEQLLVGAERAGIERAREHDRNRERRDETG